MDWNTTFLCHVHIEETLASSPRFFYLKSMRLYRAIFVFLLVIVPFSLFSQAVKPGSALKIGRLKFGGGGDWYNDPQEEENLLRFVGQQSRIDVNPGYEFTEI